jgi:hypothetical protein
LLNRLRPPRTLAALASLAAAARPIAIRGRQRIGGGASMNARPSASMTVGLREARPNSSPLTRRSPCGSEALRRSRSASNRVDVRWPMRAGRRHELIVSGKTDSSQGQERSVSRCVSRACPMGYV